MKKDWELTQEEFDRLLSWLDLDRERAGERFWQIRERIIKIFISRGCTEAEYIFYESSRRVAQKPPEFFTTYEGEPARYLYRVAQNVHLELLAQEPEIGEMPRNLTDDPPPDKEAELDCLEQCLRQLETRDRTLLERYYGEDTPTKIEARKRLAKDFNLSDNALKLRVFRLKKAVSVCLQKCLAKK